MIINLTTLDAKLQAIFGLNARDVDKNPKLGLERIEALLAKLGNPHLQLPPTVHVAGTNGKGSTVAFMRTLAESQGLKVHSYTSPHLVRFNERIVLAGHQITDHYLLELIDHVALANGEAAISFFEFVTAIALVAFAQTPADVLLLETGLGGRLDATNVLPQPAATIITSIGFDHMDYLGHTLPQIAFEKAGIMKAGVPCFVPYNLLPDVLAVFKQRASTLPCSLHQVAPLDADITLGLLGTHQAQNAALAVAAFEALGFDVNLNALASTTHAARLQKLGDEVYLDGGHNPSCSQAVADYLKTLPPMPLSIFFGCLTTKDPVAMITPFLALNPHIYTVGFNNSQAYKADALAHQLNQAFAGVNAQNFGDVASLSQAIKNTQGRVLIYGSLYLAGEVLAELKPTHS